MAIPNIIVLLLSGMIARETNTTSRRHLDEVCRAVPRVDEARCRSVPPLASFFGIVETLNFSL
ncbi:MAG: hypothetical protein ACLUYK_06540 [Eggerthella lenta]